MWQLQQSFLFFSNWPFSQKILRFNYYSTCCRMFHHIDGHSGTFICDDPQWNSKYPSFSDWNYPLSVKDNFWSTAQRTFLVPWLLKWMGFRTTVKAGWNACYFLKVIDNQHMLINSSLSLWHAWQITFFSGSMMFEHLQRQKYPNLPDILTIAMHCYCGGSGAYISF